MTAPSTTDERLTWVERVIAHPPRVHPGAPDNAAWSTEESCYRFMADQIGNGSRTLETGAGVSTVLFAAWRCDHVAVVPYASEAAAVEQYLDDQGIARDSLRFDLRPSEEALPTLSRESPFDLVFVDGCHGFPAPIIDWFYGAGLLRKGGIVVFDDIQLPQVNSLLTSFLEPDPRWETVAGTNKWKAFRRLSEGPLGEDWLAQPFFPQSSPTSGPMRRVKDLVPLPVKVRIKQWVGR
jgi:hypothetical protein